LKALSVFLLAFLLDIFFIRLEGLANEEMDNSEQQLTFQISLLMSSQAKIS